MLRIGFVHDSKTGFQHLDFPRLVKFMRAALLTLRCEHVFWCTLLFVTLDVLCFKHMIIGNELSNIVLRLCVQLLLSSSCERLKSKNVPQFGLSSVSSQSWIIFLLLFVIICIICSSPFVHLPPSPSLSPSPPPTPPPHHHNPLIPPPHPRSRFLCVLVTALALVVVPRPDDDNV